VRWTAGKESLKKGIHVIRSIQLTEGDLDVTFVFEKEFQKVSGEEAGAWLACYLLKPISGRRQERNRE